MKCIVIEIDWCYIWRNKWGLVIHHHFSAPIPWNYLIFLIGRLGVFLFLYNIYTDTNHSCPCVKKMLNLVPTFVLILAEIGIVLEVFKYAIIMWFLQFIKNKRYTWIKWTNFLICVIIGVRLIYKIKGKV